MDAHLNNTATTTSITIPSTFGLGADWRTREQFAEAMGWTVTKLTRMHVARKGPPRIKIGKSIYYYMPSVAAWLLTQQMEEPRAKRRRSSKA